MASGALRISWLVALLALALGAQGCREEEQNRVLVHEKGVYQGEPDEELAEGKIEELRSRAQGQKF